MKQSCVICLECGTILVSLYTHDYKTCGCPNEAMVDGGYDYRRCGAMSISKIIHGTWDTETNTFNKGEEAKRELDVYDSAQTKSRWPY